MNNKAKFGISILFPILFVVTTLLCIVMCNSESHYKPKESCSQSASLDFNELLADGSIMQYQIDYLLQSKTTKQSLYDRKENAAWLAFAFYISGLATFFFLNWKKVKKRLTFLKSVIISILMIVVAIITFAFIHSQYSAIYDTWFRGQASNILVKRIIDKGLPVKNLEKEHFKLYQCFKNEQKYREKYHPLKITWEFVKLNWTKQSDRNLSNPNIQEASLYLMIVLSNLIYIILIYIRLFTILWRKN